MPKCQSSLKRLKHILNSAFVSLSTCVTCSCAVGHIHGLRITWSILNWIKTTLGRGLGLICIQTCSTECTLRVDGINVHWSHYNVHWVPSVDTALDNWLPSSRFQKWLFQTKDLNIQIENFCCTNGIHRVQVAPYQLSTNSLAEREVQITKHGIKKLKSGTCKTTSSGSHSNTE